MLVRLRKRGVLHAKLKLSAPQLESLLQTKMSCTGCCAPGGRPPSRGSPGVGSMLQRCLAMNLRCCSYASESAACRMHALAIPLPSNFHMGAEASLLRKCRNRNACLGAGDTHGATLSRPSLRMSSMAFPLDLPGLFTASFHVNTGSDTSDRPGVHLRPCTCILTTLSGDALSLDANISCMVM